MKKWNNNRDSCLHRFVVNAVYEEVVKVNDNITSLLREEGIDPLMINNINLILEEITLNICNYAYPKGKPGLLELDLCVGKSEIVLIFRDTGRPFNPVEHKARSLAEGDNLDELVPGGLGIYLVKKIARKIEYSYRNQRNVLTITMGRDVKEAGGGDLL